MSILANLLKKAETNQAKGDIPPGLLQAARGPVAGNTRKKYLLLGGLAVAAVAVGGLLALYVANRPAPRTPVVQQAIPQPVVAVQKPVSSAILPPPPVQQAAPATQGTAATAALPKKAKPRHQVAAAQSVKRTGATPRPADAQPEKRTIVKDKAAIDALLFSARSAEGRRDYSVAMKQYQKALELDPHNYRIINNVASTMLQLGINDQALAMANRALAIKPDYPSAMVNAGIALEKLGHDSAARGMFSKALALDPTNRSVLFSLALAQERAGQQDDALGSYRRLAEVGDARGLLGQGRLYERRGSRSEAIRFYREVLSLPEAGQRAKEYARERIAVLDQ